MTEAEWEAVEPGLEVLADMLLEAALAQRARALPTTCELPRDHPAFAAARMFRKTSLSLRIEVIAAYGGKCALCDAPGEEVDHIVPLAAGGLSVRENLLQLLCGTCHRAKTRRELRW